MARKPLLIAEGDSWFAIPPFELVVPRDIVGHLRRLGYQVKSVADPGHTLEQMVNDTDGLKKKIEENEKPKAILLSGGGDDVFAYLPKILNHARYAKPIIDKNEAEKFVGCLEQDYVQWLRFITATCKSRHEAEVPILIHGYGYAVPANRPMWGVWRGTWLYPRFREKGHMDLQKNTDAIASLVNWFNEMLHNLPKKHGLNHVKYVDLRQCLSRDIQCTYHRDHHNYGDDEGCSAKFELDWNDEIHPTSEGFGKIAEEFRDEIQNLP
ncbi:MAG: hypothetical protein OXF11_13975 [Deltaproteobacteria bacterium]|nr:hypothetical protein [Deltaproteobacteria bacterium]